MQLLTPLRIVAVLEGISYILLLFIATPLKYLKDMPHYVELLGMPHGILFMLYVVLAILISDKMRWSKKTLAIVLVASIIPFGTFYIDKKYFRQ
ncbi:MAG: DUF3817 domain-containing protein [Chitinophagales bacterium]